MSNKSFSFDRRSTYGKGKAAQPVKSHTPGEPRAEPMPEPMLEAAPEPMIEPVDPAPAADDRIDRLTQALEAMAVMQLQLGDSMTELQKQFAARAEVRPGAREEVRQETRHRARASAPAQITDREGNVVSRKSFDAINPFELPPDFIAAIKAEHYSVEWKTEFVYNERQHTYMAGLQAYGAWVPVKNERLPGMFPGEPEEPVRYGGLILMERPLALTEQARRESDKAAQDQVNARQRNWGVSSKNRAYFDPDTPGAKQFTMLNRVMEPTDASWAPEHTLAVGDDF